MTQTKGANWKVHLLLVTAVSIISLSACVALGGQGAAPAGGGGTGGEAVPFSKSGGENPQDYPGHPSDWTAEEAQIWMMKLGCVPSKAWARGDPGASLAADCPSKGPRIPSEHVLAVQGTGKQYVAGVEVPITWEVSADIPLTFHVSDSSQDVWLATDITGEGAGEGTYTMSSEVCTGAGWNFRVEYEVLGIFDWTTCLVTLYVTEYWSGGKAFGECFGFTGAAAAPDTDYLEITYELVFALANPQTKETTNTVGDAEVGINWEHIWDLDAGEGVGELLNYSICAQ